ncbi:MAG: arginine decarboxylase [Bacteroidetes bacterium GWF2_33_38]|nr:MAG: arginine decarboxylase [Bacteroidetes bacterium GWF2_33_38]OFY73610.1 MAG: arginine decarboxylase [Bacteroidetes bacterium RIFOXYA12_FULL_33_9]OFY92352.1 MAG: arginine decarboxylase [Bacteroidetes bacterium RIFOXYA2_FULL_33_7]HBX50653.1 arginine decarboxylase [Bacteroidales bacterium]
MIKKILFILTVSTLLASCATVQPYQKMYLNDEDMKLSSHGTEAFETGIEGYREGSAGANGGKTGGGCGCN